MYRIVQVLNNNVAIIKTKSGQQAIVMGKGIIFGKKKGDLISETNIINLFVMKDEALRESFSILLKDVPLDFIATTYEIIEHAIDSYHYPVQEYIYVTLTDHIFLNYQRLQKDEYQLNLLPDIKEQYPVEYQIAVDALEIIQKKLGITFPKEEIKSISLHFINAKGMTDDSSSDAYRDNKKQVTMEQIETELRKNNIMRNRDNQNFYDRMMIHLRYMLERIESEQQDKDAFADKMAIELEKEYPKASHLSNQLYQIISKGMGIQFNTNEKVYFTIHIQRLL